jgi:hypothetical protein
MLTSVYCLFSACFDIFYFVNDPSTLSFTLPLNEVVIIFTKKQEEN